MSTKKQNTTALTTAIITPAKVFIGIDYHKRYSVYHVLDEARENGVRRKKGNGFGLIE